MDQFLEMQIIDQIFYFSRELIYNVAVTLQ